jgi:hypothetical protein
MSGWIVLKFSYGDASRTRNIKIWYHHGWGGGGPVTKGTIQNNRVMTSVQGADIIWMGHVHEHYNLDYQIEYLNRNNESQSKRVEHVRTPTYKEEYFGSGTGFHIERGAPPKPLGSYALHVHYGRELDTEFIKLK